MKNRYRIIHEDDYLWVVNKPAGLLSIPGRYDRKKPSVKELLENREGETVYTLHRLDLWTSGLNIFAKTAETHAFINDQFSRRDVKKEYRLVVRGVTQEPLNIDLPVAQQKPGVMEIRQKGGKKSRTLFEPLMTYKNFTYGAAFPETGRTHQIRVHMAHEGYPIVADIIYGKEGEFYVSEIKGKKYNLGKHEVERPLVTRPLLHAYKINFQHPQNLQRVEYIAKEPKDFRAMRHQLKKWDN